jgi:hypothetical protein
VEEKESTLRGKKGGKYGNEVQSQSTGGVVLKISTITLWSFIGHK